MERSEEEEEDDESSAGVNMVKSRYSNKNKSTVISYEGFSKQDTTKRDHFHKTIFNTLKEKLRSTMRKQELHAVNDEDLKEVAQHILICQENVANVNYDEERVSEIPRNIISYLEKNTKMPLVVHGSPGAAKTTIVAMAAKLASDKMVDGTTLVTRFLGSTRHSSNLRFLLRSICFHLAKAQGDKDTTLPQVRVKF